MTESFNTKVTLTNLSLVHNNTNYLPNFTLIRQTISELSSWEYVVRHGQTDRPVLRFKIAALSVDLTFTIPKIKAIVSFIFHYFYKAFSEIYTVQFTVLNRNNDVKLYLVGCVLKLLYTIAYRIVTYSILCKIVLGLN